MKKLMNHTLLHYLAIFSAMWGMHTAAVQSAHAEDASAAKAHATLAARATAEAHNTDYVECDGMLMPKAVADIGGVDLKYSGVFRRTANSDGERSKLQTFVNKVGVESDNWDFEVGRSNLRQFANETSTVGFDNYTSAKLSRTFTGAFATHKPSNVTLGLCASDTAFGPSHVDEVLGSWSHRFGDQLGAQIHLAATLDCLEKAGLAVEWSPTDRASLLADAVYSKTGTSGMLLGNYQASDRVKLFAGGEVTAPCDSGATGKFVAGLEGDLGHGVKAIGAVQHDCSFHHGGDETMAVLGIKVNGNKTLF